MGKVCSSACCFPDLRDRSSIDIHFCVMMHITWLIYVSSTCDVNLQVYELSADVCAAAGCWPELLKTLGQAVTTLYPAAAAAIASATAATASGSGGDSADANRGSTSSTTAGTAGEPTRHTGDAAAAASSAAVSPAHTKSAAVLNQTPLPAGIIPAECGAQQTAAAQPNRAAPAAAASSALAAGATAASGTPAATQECAVSPQLPPSDTIAATQPSADRQSPFALFPRYQELLGAYIMFFACVPAQPDAFELGNVLRRLPPSHLRCQGVQTSLAVASAALRGDFIAFYRLLAAATPLQRRIMQPGLCAMRSRSVRTAAAAYQKLPLETMQRFAHLADGDTLGGAGILLHTSSERELDVIEALLRAEGSRGCRPAAIAADALLAAASQKNDLAIEVVFKG